MTLQANASMHDGNLFSRLHAYEQEILPVKKRRSVSTSSAPSAQVINEMIENDNHQVEPTMECLYSRVRYNSVQNVLLLNFVCLHVQNTVHINNILTAVANILASHSKESNNVRLMVNFDGFKVDECVKKTFMSKIDEHFTDKHFLSVQRFSTKNFMDDSLARLKSPLPPSPSEEIPNRIVASKYKLVKTLGEGTYGVVWLALNQVSGFHVAIKEYNKKSLKNIPELGHYVLNEIEILKKIKDGHPNVVNLLEHSETDEHHFLVMEFCQLGCLESNHDPHQQFDEAIVHKYFVQMADALDFLHEQHQIAHRDFQLSNICVDINDNIKIVDFGVSDFFKHNQTMNIMCGNSAYACPEMLLGKPFVGPEADVWSLGCCLYKMLTGYHPFRNAQKALVRDLMIPLEEEEDLSDSVKDLINHILCLDVTKRYTMKDIKNHAWYRTGPR